MKLINITQTSIKPQEVIDSVCGTASGAINVFIGTIRDQSRGKAVIRLEYEAYESMAQIQIAKILDQADGKWNLQKVSVVHRVGTLVPGDVAVVIAVATPHRQASFEACQFIIDTLKERVPIWKKEIFQGGEEWISATP